MIDYQDPKALLRTLEQRARRRFGQHFLTRPDLVERMVERAGVTRGSRVVEIGPGLGILTQALVTAGAEVTAVEVDRDLAEHIRGHFSQVQLVEQDATRVDWAALCPGEGWRVVANLPYNVGTNLIVELLRHSLRFTSVTVMLQKEVVKRFLAEAGSDAYGSLSVYVQSRARGYWLFEVPPGCFYPPPKVDSVVVRLEPLPEPLVGPAGEDNFDRVVRAAFAQRRKTITNSLTTVYERDTVLQALQSVGISPTIRAEMLEIEAFRALAAALHPAGRGESS